MDLREQAGPILVDARQRDLIIGCIGKGAALLGSRSSGYGDRLVDSRSRDVDSLQREGRRGCIGKRVLRAPPCQKRKNEPREDRSSEPERFERTHEKALHMHLTAHPMFPNPGSAERNVPLYNDVWRCLCV